MNAYSGFNIRQAQVTASVTTINLISNYSFRLDRTTDNSGIATSYATQQVPSGSFRYLLMELLQSHFPPIIQQ